MSQESIERVAVEEAVERARERVMVLEQGRDSLDEGFNEAMQKKQREVNQTQEGYYKARRTIDQEIVKLEGFIENITPLLGEVPSPLPFPAGDTTDSARA